MDEQCAYIRVAIEHSKLKRIADAFTVEKTVKEIMCYFEFRTEEWDSLQKTAVFIKGGSNTAVHVVLDSTNSCMVPAEVLEDSGEFSIGVFGSDNTHRLPTNLLPFRIHKGCYVAGTAPTPPTPSVYEQILAQLAAKQDQLTAGTGVSIVNNVISANGDKTYLHNQRTASSTWSITHNLGKYPSASVVDSGNNVVIGDVSYINQNELQIKFNAPFSGKCFLN